MDVLFERLNFTAWGEERGSAQDWSFQRRTSLYLGAFNTNYYLFNHPVTAHRDGLPGMSAVGLGCCECVWGQDLSLLPSRKAAMMVLSKQPDVHPSRNDSSVCSHHPCHTPGKGGTGVSDNRDSLAGLESSPDGCCHKFISSRGFQAIRVIRHNWKSHI